VHTLVCSGARTYATWDANRRFFLKANNDLDVEAFNIDDATEEFNPDHREAGGEVSAIIISPAWP